MALHRNRPEVHTKSDAFIEKETAIKWAGRAIDCYTTYMKTGNIHWLTRAHSYNDEALEHAALVRDQGKTVKAVETLLRQVARDSQLVCVCKPKKGRK